MKKTNVYEAIAKLDNEAIIKIAHTIANNGGASIPLQRFNDNKGGYMVSLPICEYIVELHGGTSWLESAQRGATVARQYIDFLLSERGEYLNNITMDTMEIMQADGVYLGIWCNESKVYFDISININNKYAAMRFGRIGGQIAIWDVENEQEITL